MKNNSPVSKTAKSFAEKHYNSWSDYIREEGVYLDFNANDLPPPLKNEILNEYIVRLSQQVEAIGWGPKKQERATKAFLHYLRIKNKQAEIAFIEHIFPEKCDLRAAKIIRIIRPQVHPISKEIAGTIIRELAYQCA